jgi:hypothetical protein
MWKRPPPEHDDKSARRRSTTAIKILRREEVEKTSALFTISSTSHLTHRAVGR